MEYNRFLTYSMQRVRPVKVLLDGDKLKYQNLTVTAMDDEGITALKAGRKSTLYIPYNQILAVSYARGDDGDTIKDIYQTTASKGEKQ